MADGFLAKLINPQKMLEQLASPEMMLDIMKQMGVDPEALMQEFERWKAEFEGMKDGTRAALTHFNNRLDGIERKQDQMIALLQRIGDNLSPALTNNCVQEGVREITDGQHHE